MITFALALQSSFPNQQDLPSDHPGSGSQTAVEFLDADLFWKIPSELFSTSSHPHWLPRLQLLSVVLLLLVVLPLLFLQSWGIILKSVFLGLHACVPASLLRFFYPYWLAVWYASAWESNA